MANQLKMAKIHSILTLHQQGWSNRRIARTLGIHRHTVGRYIVQACGDSKSTTNPPAGSAAKSTNPPAGSSAPPEVPSRTDDGFIALRPTARGDSVLDAVAEDTALLGSNRSAAAGPYGTGGFESIGAASFLTGGSVSGPISASEPYRPIILAKLEKGLTAQRIYQDLRTEHGFAGSYDSVKRFVRRLRQATPLPFRRMECAPGAEAQVDFGTGSPILESDGPSTGSGRVRRRKTHVIRVVLSHSRKAYSESVFRQTTDDFLLCLENAFGDFGGVPRTIVIDNLKAAVKHPDWYDPELNPKVQSFCERYGTVILPARPYTPRHKGKVERGIGYVQSNALKGRTFRSLSEQNAHLQHWESTVADTRIHGTTRKQVGKVFQEVEREALLPLPAGRFPNFQEARRSVHRDGHVEVDKAYYSVPPEYMGRRLWVRWDGRIVRVFNTRMEQVAVHAQRQPGQFSTQNRHIHSQKISAVERGAERLLRRISLIGEHSERWASAMLLARGVAGLRVLVGLRSLTHQYDSERIEHACRIALTHQAFHLRAVRELLKRDQGRQEEFAFLAEHEIIRDLSSYEHIVRAAVRQEPARLQLLES